MSIKFKVCCEYVVYRICSFLGKLQIQKIHWFSCFSVCFFGFSFSAYAFDLSEAYQKSLVYNADYLSKIAKNQAEQEPLVQAKAGLLPQINAVGNMNESYLNNQGNGAYYTYHQPTAILTFNQVIFDYSKFSAYTKGKYSQQVADLELATAKQGLVIDVAQAYFDVLYAMDLVEATKITQNALEQEMIQAQKKFESGIVNVTDVNDTQSAFDAISADLIKNENDLINKQNIFRNLTGLNPDLIQPVIEQINLVPPVPLALDMWVERAAVDNWSVKLAYKQVQMAVEDINIEKGGHLPNFSLSGQYQYNGTPIIDGADSQQTYANISGTLLSPYNQTSIGLQINIPIYSGGSISSKVREKMATYEMFQSKLISAKRVADQMVKNAYWQVQNGIRIVKAQTQALKSAKLKLQSDKLGYQVGTRNSIDLVNAQKNYYTVLQNYNKARYDYLMANLKLHYNVGHVETDILKLVNMNIKQ